MIEDYETKVHVPCLMQNFCCSKSYLKTLIFVTDYLINKEPVNFRNTKTLQENILTFSWIDLSRKYLREYKVIIIMLD